MKEHVFKVVFGSERFRVAYVFIYKILITSVLHNNKEERQIPQIIEAVFYIRFSFTIITKQIALV